jgi:peroxiredoxin
VLKPAEAVPTVEMKPVFGRAVSLPSSLNKGRLLLVFVGALSNPRADRVLTGLGEIYGDLERAGVRLVAVTGSSERRAQDYVPRHHVLFPVVVDEDSTLRVCFGLPKRARGLARLREPISAIKTRIMEPQADGPMAWFLLGVDGRIQSGAQAQPDPEALLAAALDC